MHSKNTCAQYLAYFQIVPTINNSATSATVASLFLEDKFLELELLGQRPWFFKGFDKYFRLSSHKVLLICIPHAKEH